VKAAAKALKFSVIELRTDADRALAAGAHEGVLKGSGRMIVGSVSAEVYRRIEEHVRKGAGAPDPSKSETAAVITTKSAKGASGPDPSRPETATTTTKPSEQTTNTSAPAKPDSAPARETLRVGARVLAAYWNEKREFEGFWLATSSGSTATNTPSSGSTRRNIRRSRAGPRTSRCPIPSSASRASDPQTRVFGNSKGAACGSPPTAADDARLRKIFDAANSDPAFTLRRSDADAVITELAQLLRLSQPTIARAKREAGVMCLTGVRAEAKARFLVTYWDFAATRN
jgi:hypothetical protein